MPNCLVELFGVALIASTMGGAPAAGNARPAPSQTAGPAAQTAASALAQPPRKNPFGRLFRPPVEAPSRPHLRATVPPSPSNSRVVCGTIVIEGDPNVDPGIRIPTPRPAEQFRIRTVGPAWCYGR